MGIGRGQQECHRTHERGEGGQRVVPPDRPTARPVPGQQGDPGEQHRPEGHLRQESRRRAATARTSPTPSSAATARPAASPTRARYRAGAAASAAPTARTTSSAAVARAPWFSSGSRSVGDSMPAATIVSTPATQAAPVTTFRSASAGQAAFPPTRSRREHPEHGATADGEQHRRLDADRIDPVDRDVGGDPETTEHHRRTAPPQAPRPASTSPSATAMIAMNRRSRAQ